MGIKVSDIKKRKFNEGVSAIIYAPPQFGKTTLADKDESVVMFNTDGNIKTMKSRAYLLDKEPGTNSKGKKASAWMLFVETLMKEMKNPETKTIVLDLMEDIYELSMEHSVKFKRGFETINDVPDKALPGSKTTRGSVWKELQDSFIYVLKILNQWSFVEGKDVIWLGHSKETKVVIGTNEITKYKTFLSDKMESKLAGHVDLWGFGYFHKKERVLIVNPTENIRAGNRLNIEKPYIDFSLESIRKEIKEANKEGNKNE